MRFKQKLLLLLLLMFSMYGAALANDPVVIDDIAYLLDESTKEAEVTNHPSKKYSSVTIPSHVTYEGVEYTVVKLGFNGVSTSTNMGTIVIPNTVRTFRVGCFQYVNHIEKIVIEDGNDPIELGRQNVSLSAELREWEMFNGVEIDQLYLGRNCNKAKSENGYEMNIGFGGDIKSVTLGEGVTKVLDKLFSDQKSLTEVIWNTNITKIGTEAFQNCSALKEILITSPVDTIGDRAFCNVGNFVVTDETKLNISLPETLKYIGPSAFERSGVFNITLPSNLKHLGSWAFDNCKYLTKVNIPWGLEELGSGCFDSTAIEELIIPPSTKLLDQKSSFSYLPALKKFIYWPTGWLGKFPSNTNDAEIWITEPSYSVFTSREDVKAFPCKRINKKEYLYGYKFDLTDFYPGAEIHSIDVYLKGKKVRTIPVNSENQYYIKNLSSGKDYFTVLHFTADGHESTDSARFNTENMFLGDRDRRNTQRTITVSMPSLDESIENLTAIGYSLDDGEIVWRNPDELRTTPMFTELTPDTEYKLTCYLKVADLDEPVLVGSYTSKTLSAVGREKKEVGPSSIRLTFEKCTGDDYVTYERIKYKLPGSSSFKEVSSNTLESKDLKPNSKIEYEYWGHLNSDPITGWSVQLYKLQSGTITTDALTLKTLPVKIVNKGEVIVAASTNAWDIDENLSFMWGKNDAPAGMQFPEAKAVVCDGQIEGYISNLSDTYYKVCAKYTFTDGTYKTSDWVIFDPTEFSFFTPTIREYDATEVSEKNATLRAYVMRGSEEILEQGFEYHTETSSRIMRRSASRAEGAWDTDDVVKVFGSGQVMTVELTDLKPGTNYVARAFVTTASGTDYGNEIRFKTTGTPEAAVEAVEAEDSEVTVKAIYDINGRRLSEPQKGINIVIMSDGSARKIVK